jgi:hypothetical protein
MQNLRRPYGKGSIQHASAKHKAIATPTCLILPVAPHKLVACISFAAPTRHDGAYHDGDEDAHEDEEEANVRELGQSAVGKHDDEAGEPGDDEVDDEDVPAFEGVPRVE